MHVFLCIRYHIDGFRLQAREKYHWYIATLNSAFAAYIYQVLLPSQNMLTLTSIVRISDHTCTSKVLGSRAEYFFSVVHCITRNIVQCCTIVSIS